MVTGTLTKEMIDSGRELVHQMDKRHLGPDSAFWLYDSDSEKWKLMIVDQKLAEEGPRKIYERIQDTLSAAQDDLSEMSLDSVYLAKPDHPIVILLKKQIHTGSDIHGIRFTGNVINGTLIEDAYIYRLS